MLGEVPVCILHSRGGRAEALSACRYDTAHSLQFFEFAVWGEGAGRGLWTLRKVDVPVAQIVVSYYGTQLHLAVVGRLCCARCV